MNKQKKTFECLDLIKSTYGSFPNISIALKILLTLLITTTRAERSFSKLKIIKDYLRVTMLQDRLSDLTINSIEPDLCENVDYSNIIGNFVKINAIKVNFY